MMVLVAYFCSLNMMQLILVNNLVQVAGGCPASLRSGRWLDLYSGTASVGIEALSRGCSEVIVPVLDIIVSRSYLRYISNLVFSVS